jgi:hypothetical protein
MNDWPTTLRHPRTMRVSGTEYAASIERTRRHDASGKLIVALVLALVAFAWVLS